MPRALVTGGTGFLGRHLVRGFMEGGYEVRALDVNPPSPADGDFDYVEGDVRDPATVRRAARGCDVVVDNAALVPVTRASAEEFRSVNVGGCRNVLQAARDEDAYVVHVSSSSIYGRPEELPVTEATPLRPFEPYGRSKAEAEVLVRREREGGLAVASLRSRALIGRGRLGLFEIVFRRIRDGRRVPMFGSGEITIQMCDADDLVTAALAAVERQANGDYNVAAASYGTVREDLERLIAHAGSGARVLPVPVWAIRAALQPLALVGRSPFTKWHWVAPSVPFWCDLSRVRDELGWEPRYSNSEALARAYDRWLAEPEDVGDSGHRRPLTGALARVLRG